MPDTNPSPDPSTTARSPRKESSTSSSAPASRSAESKARKVHQLLQGKGGVGKSYIASLIAQYLKEQGEPVVCLDTDAVNASLSDIPALSVSRINLFEGDGDEIDTDALDGMVERFLTEDANFVVDNGATSFKPLSRYLIQDGIADTIAGNGKRMVVHTVVAGGQEFAQTVRGFDSIAGQFPESVELVLWLNEHHGRLTADDGTTFEGTPVYQKHASRIAGVVKLPQLHKAFADNLRDMLGRNLTFAEAMEDRDIFTVAKQRLVQIRRPIWEQLALVM